MRLRIENIWFFIVFIPMIYVCYMLLMCFDYQKILRRNKVGDLKALMIIISVGIAYLFASAFIEVVNRMISFF